MIQWTETSPPHAIGTGGIHRGVPDDALPDYVHKLELSVTRSRSHEGTFEWSVEYLGHSPMAMQTRRRPAGRASSESAAKQRAEEGAELLLRFAALENQAV